MTTQFAEQLGKWLENAEREHEREVIENKCRHCGGPLSAFWKDGIVDSLDEPMFECGPCLTKED